MSGKVQRPEEASEKLPTQDRSLSPRPFPFLLVSIGRTKDLGLTRRIKHYLNSFRMVCTIATHDEFKAVGRYEGNMRRGLGDHNCGVSRRR